MLVSLVTLDNKRAPHLPTLRPGVQPGVPHEDSHWEGSRGEAGAQGQAGSSEDGPPDSIHAQLILGVGCQAIITYDKFLIESEQDWGGAHLSPLGVAMETKVQDGGTR